MVITKLPTTEFKKRQATRRRPANNVIVTDGSRVRSPFARFDPEFKHLRNISASVVQLDVDTQLLQKPEVTAEEIEEYLSGWVHNGAFVSFSYRSNRRDPLTNFGYSEASDAMQDLTNVMQPPDVDRSTLNADALRQDYLYLSPIGGLLRSLQD